LKVIIQTERQTDTQTFNRPSTKPVTKVAGNNRYQLYHGTFNPFMHKVAKMAALTSKLKAMG